MTREKIMQAVNLFKRLDHLNETHRALKEMNLDTTNLSGHAPIVSFTYAKPNPSFDPNVKDKKTPPTPKALEQKVHFNPDAVSWAPVIDAQLTVIEDAIRITHEQLKELGVDP